MAGSETHCLILICKCGLLNLGMESLFLFMSIIYSLSFFPLPLIPTANKWDFFSFLSIHEVLFLTSLKTLITLSH